MSNWSHKPWLAAAGAIAFAVLTVTTPIAIIQEHTTEQHVEQVATATQTETAAIDLLLTDGKTASAQNSKKALAEAKQGDAIIAQVESLIEHGDVRGDQNHDLICVIAELFKDPPSALQTVIHQDCVDASS